MWTAETSNGHESAKIAGIAVPYLQGRFLDLGAGNSPVWPSAITVDNGAVFGASDVSGIRCDVSDLSMFAGGCMDAVFSSHVLEDFEPSRVPAVLAEWARVLKVGGNLVLYVPSANLYPKHGTEGANPAHKWDIYPGDIEAILKKMESCGWELLESEERGDTNEYSLFIVARKRESGWVDNVWQRNPQGKKRALIIRYGAIGDAIQASSVAYGLKKKGYFVTYNTTPQCKEIIKHDPNIDEWLIQATDYVPNHELGPYWESIAPRYDFVVNLCESIEGGLLGLPGRMNHGWCDETRRRIMGTVNYMERHHDLAALPYDFRPAFYASPEEDKWARAVLKSYGAPTIIWGINGSSNHKVYPWVNIVVKWLLERTPAHIVLTGDAGVGKQLQDGILATLEGCDLSRVHGVAGIWTIRQSLTFAQHADCVIGPETGLLNSVCMASVPKIVMLSHSSHTNLTRDWVNTTVLEPDREIAPCFPCHRLHTGWEFCHKSDETHAALCASAIAPRLVFEAAAIALGARKAA